MVLSTIFGSIPKSVGGWSGRRELVACGGELSAWVARGSRRMDRHCGWLAFFGQRQCATGTGLTSHPVMENLPGEELIESLRSAHPAAPEVEETVPVLAGGEGQSLGTRRRV